MNEKNDLDSRELTITRLIDAPRERIFAAWTDPALLAQWWAPAPWGVSKVDMDFRVGGRAAITMRSPDGAEYPNDGVFLEVVENEKIVFTDAFTVGWEPKPDPFITAIVTMEDEEGKTRYTAQVRHWTVEARVRHEEMGFFTGWNLCLDQLAALVTGMAQAA